MTDIESFAEERENAEEFADKPMENKFGYYRLGLDIGIASVGWACMACDDAGNVQHILDLGVRAFDVPENPKDGSSLAAPRREKRSLRRRLRRRAFRLERARAVLGVPQENPDDYKNVQRADIYELRARALDEKVSEADFARILLLLLKRRGYQSNSKRDTADDEGKVKEAIAENVRRMEENGYRTVGEMLYKTCAIEADGRRIYAVRNHGNYEHCVSRESLTAEVHALFAAQRQFGNPLAGAETEEAFTEIFTAQRNFDDGPGKGSTYTYAAADMVGKCPYHPTEKRIAKATFSFEYFRLLQTVNHMQIVSGGHTRFLTKDERARLIDFCLYKEKVTYEKVRKTLNLTQGDLFVGLDYGKAIAKEQRKDKQKAKAEKKVAAGQIGMFESEAPQESNEGDAQALRHKQAAIKQTESKARFSAMPCSAKIRACLSEQNQGNRVLYDSLGDILTKYKSEKKIRTAFAESELCAALSDEEQDLLTALSFAGYGHVGPTVIGKMLPYLEEGDIYSTAMERAGYDHANPFGERKRSALIRLNARDFREELEDITSPAVRRAVSQTVKVFNAVVRKYGSPLYINVELAREMSKSWEERKAIKKENDARWENKEKDLQNIKDTFHIANPSGKHWIKWRLYEEQNGKCMYSGKQMDLARVLTDEKYAEVDHIIPYSRSFCDAQYNKVLVLTEENQKKGNAIPKEYLGDGEAWEAFCARVNALYMRNPKKREMFLRETFSVEDGKAWKDRTLTDTKYISRFMYNLFRNRVTLAKSDAAQKKRVKAVNGAVTSFARKLWGIRKVREDGDLHHAADAVVIACISDGFIADLSRWSKGREWRYAYIDGKTIDYETGIVVTPDTEHMLYRKQLPKPHEKFTEELELRLSNVPMPEGGADLYFSYGYDSEAVGNVRPVFVSRAPERKAKGAIHKDTVYSRDPAGNTTLKKELTTLKLDKNGEIENYNAFAKQSDTTLYNALKKRLQAFDGDGAKAFIEPFYKPKADGTPGPLVKKVLIDQITDAHVPLKRGHASNDGMVRVDIFCKDGKFYGVPVYVADVYRGVLPNKAVVAFKPEDEWLEMTDEYEYRFSLYKNDLIKIRNDKGIDFRPLNKSLAKIAPMETYAYYKSFNRAIGTMDIILHDNSYIAESKGIQRLQEFTKYEVDMLGNIHAIHQEKRPPAQLKKK